MTMVVAHFGSLQNWRSEADGELVYYVFDILYLNGYDLKDCHLVERREILKKNLPENTNIRLSENFDTTATEFLEAQRRWVWKASWQKKQTAIMPRESEQKNG